MLLMVQSRKIKCSSIDNVFYGVCSYFVLKIGSIVRVLLFKSISGLTGQLMYWTICILYTIGDVSGGKGLALIYFLFTLATVLLLR